MDQTVWYHRFMNSLTLFIVLQIADILSTLAFLAIGVHEGNPAIRLLLHVFSPVVSLLIVKIFGIAIGVVWYRLGRSFTKINIAFALLIVWNFVAIFLQVAPKIIPLIVSK